LPVALFALVTKKLTDGPEGAFGPSSLQPAAISIAHRITRCLIVICLSRLAGAVRRNAAASGGRAAAVLELRRL
jgi:hypothetical protein